MALLAGQVVVVCGVGPGLGRSIALASARAGADVVLAARTASRLDEVAKEVTALGRRARGEHHVRPSPRAGQRDRPPQARADAGDHYHLARQQRHQPSIRAATAAWRAAILAA